MERKRKIYDGDAVSIEQSETPANSVSRETSSNTTTKSARRTAKKIERISIADVIDALAGYLPPQANFMQNGTEGTCVICGGGTSNEMRKICFECMKRDGKKICDSAKEAAENGDTDFVM